MNELQIFNNEEFGEVRTMLVNDEPMFCLIDICKALEIKNATDVAKRLDEDELTRLNLGSRAGETNFITESGLYAVILRSDKPNAKKFRKWVTSEVLPSIRKTGSYNKPMTTKEKIQLLAQGNEELNERVDIVEEKVTGLENNMTIDYGQQVAIGYEVNKVVINALGGKRNRAYKEMSKKVFAECNRDIKHYFHVNARNNVPKKRFDEAIQYIQNWHPCTNTQMMINMYNSSPVEV